MKWINYLLFQIYIKIRNQKRRFFWYIVSFYIGMLLPAFCLANIRSVENVIYYTTFKDMKDSIQIEWFSEHFNIVSLRKEYLYSISGFYEEVFSLWDNSYIAIKGIDENYLYPLPEVEGRLFEKNELKCGRNVCLLNKQYAEKFSCQISDSISIRNTKFEIIGIVQEATFPGIIIPYKAMEKVYSGEENIQFTGTFLVEENNKEHVMNEVFSQINNNEAIFIRETEGMELYESAYRTKIQWRSVRVAIGFVALLFFLFNQITVLLEKLEEEKHIIGINRALGASIKAIKISLFIENLFLTILAVSLVLLTIQPLAKIVSLENIIIVDKIVILELLLLSFVTSELLTIALMNRVKKMNISTMLKKRD